MLKILFILWLIGIIWLVWEFKNAPLMDDDGNVIEKKENKK